MTGKTIGIVATWGAGSGLVADPLVPGQKIRPVLAMASAPSPFTHVTYPPKAAKFDWGMQGMVTVTWTIPMHTYFTLATVAQLVSDSTPFYSAYITAFAKHLTLNATCREAYLMGADTKVPKDGSMGFIEWTLTVTERLNLPTAA